MQNLKFLLLPLLLTTTLSAQVGPVLEQPFVRGDIDSSGTWNIADVILILNVVFEGAIPLCDETYDTNDDDDINVADAVTLLDFIFNGGSMAHPLNICVTDPGDLFGCDQYTCP